MNQLADWPSYILDVESTGGFSATGTASDKKLLEGSHKGLTVNRSLKLQSLQQIAEPDPVPPLSERLGEEVQATGESEPSSYQNCSIDLVLRALIDSYAYRVGLQSPVSRRWGQVGSSRWIYESSQTLPSRESATHLTISRDSIILTVTEKILEFADLESDWDSYGAQPISLKAVQKAIKLISNIADQFYNTKGEKIRPFDIAPRSDGGVQFEWRSAKGSLEVEIRLSQGYGYLLILGQGEARTFEEGDNATTSDILTLFSRIIG